MGGLQGPPAPDDVRAFFTTWIDSNNNGDWDSVVQLLHPDVVLSDPMTPQAARGRAAAVLRVRAQYDPFPDGRIEMIGGAFVSLDEPELAYRWRLSVRICGRCVRRDSPPPDGGSGSREHRCSGSAITSLLTYACSSTPQMRPGNCLLPRVRAVHSSALWSSHSGFGQDQSPRGTLTGVAVRSGPPRRPGVRCERVPLSRRDITACGALRLTERWKSRTAPRSAAHSDQGMAERRRPAQDVSLIAGASGTWSPALQPAPV